jgi:hypothetical protein
MKKAILYLALAITALSSCEKKDDVQNENPIITILTPLISDTVCEKFETNVLKHNALQPLTINFNIKGNATLSEYKIVIHENEDCHSHGKRPEKLDEDHLEINKTVKVDTKNQDITETLALPENTILGNYHLTIQLIDINGREAEEKEINLVLE